MSDDLSEFLDFHLPGYEYLWNCAICLRPVISGVALMFQYLELFEDSVFLILTIVPGAGATNVNTHIMLIV